MSKYINYMNTKDGLRKIYTREEIGKMSTKEFTQNEKQIDYQMQKVGIPTVSQLNDSDSNVEYVWHTAGDDKVCEECQDLDGQIFHSISDIPDKPHPNCRCYVEEVEVKDA